MRRERGGVAATIKHKRMQGNYHPLPPPRQAALDRSRQTTCKLTPSRDNTATASTRAHLLPISLVGTLPSGAMRHGSKLRVQLREKREVAAEEAEKAIGADAGRRWWWWRRRQQQQQHHKQQQQQRTRSP